MIESNLPHQKDRAKAIATALIALDIGLAIQHFVDPDDVPLDLYPELYVLLFGPYRAAAAREARRPEYYRGSPGLARPAVDADHGGAAEADVVLQRDVDLVDLTLLGESAQLPVELRALREAGRAERVALRDQPAARIDDRAVAAVRRRLALDELWPSPSAANPSAS